MRQAEAARLVDMVEDDEAAQRPARDVGSIEGIDQRQAVGEAIGEADREQGTRAVLTAGSTARAILGQHRVDMRVLDHHGEIERRHVGHAPLGMAGVEIGAEEDVVLVGRFRRDEDAQEIGVHPDRAALA